MPYIDRDELRRWIEGEIKSPSCPVGERAFGRRILVKIATTPTADVVEKERYDRLLENSTIIADALSKYQAADMVEVVRCKDCKHRPTGTGVNHDLEFPDDECPCQCEDYWYSWMPPDDWFCPNGERS